MLFMHVAEDHGVVDKLLESHVVELQLEDAIVDETDLKVACVSFCEDLRDFIVLVDSLDEFET